MDRQWRRQARGLNGEGRARGAKWRRKRRNNLVGIGKNSVKDREMAGSIKGGRERDSYVRRLSSNRS